jgi:hypothetical protein
VKFSASTIDKGCEIHPGAFVELPEAEFVCAKTGAIATQMAVPNKIDKLRNNSTAQRVLTFIECIIDIQFPRGEPFRREENTSDTANVQYFAGDIQPPARSKLPTL